MILIRPRIMPGCKDWWDRNVGPTLLLRQHVDEAMTEGQAVVWWLPDGRLLTDRPALPTDWTHNDKQKPSMSELESYYAMPQRAVILEYGDSV